MLGLWAPYQMAPDAEAKAKMLEGDPKFDGFATMMVKTHLSLTHDPTLKGVPKGWTLPVRDVLIYSGAKFLLERFSSPR